MKFTISQTELKNLCAQAPEFIPVVQQAHIEDFECGGDLFRALVVSIISQQLSVTVADRILGRVEALTGSLTPENILAADPEKLRECGLSQRKVEYIKGVAEAAASGEIDFEELSGKSDAEVIEKLVALRGVGVWTAEMLLIFALGRKDVLSLRDLGVRKGVMALNGLAELPESDYEFYTKRYSPYGSIASLLCWQIKDGGIKLKG